MTGREIIESIQLRGLTHFRTSVGIPVSCEIFAESTDGGDPVILRSIEIEESSGVRILSQSPLSEVEVLRIYREWRQNPENRVRIQRISVEPIRIDYRKKQRQ